MAGEIEREDYDDVLVPELRPVIEAGGRLRTLYLIEDLDEIEPGALWTDVKLGFKLGVRHHEAWARLAIVTDIHWMARATSLFAWMIPRGGARLPGRGAGAGKGLGRGRLTPLGSHVSLSPAVTGR